MSITLSGANLPWPEPKIASLVVPVGTRIDAYMFDINRRLWVLLKAGDRRALVIWELLTGTARLVIPWTDRPIELGKTRASSHLLQDIAVAGFAGEPKFTSYSEAARQSLLDTMAGGPPRGAAPSRDVVPPR